MTVWVSVFRRSFHPAHPCPHFHEDKRRQGAWVLVRSIEYDERESCFLPSFYSVTPQRLALASANLTRGLLSYAGGPRFRGDDSKLG